MTPGAVKPSRALLAVLSVAAAALGCRTADDTEPVSRNVQTTSASVPARTAEPALGPEKITTEWTSNGPRVRTSPDLNDMGLHHPAEDEPFSGPARTACEAERDPARALACHAGAPAARRPGRD